MRTLSRCSTAPRPLTRWNPLLRRYRRSPAVRPAAAAATTRSWTRSRRSCISKRRAAGAGSAKNSPCGEKGTTLSRRGCAVFPWGLTDAVQNGGDVRRCERDYLLRYGVDPPVGKPGEAAVRVQLDGERRRGIRSEPEGILDLGQSTRADKLIRGEEGGRFIGRGEKRLVEQCAVLRYARVVRAEGEDLRTAAAAGRVRPLPCKGNADQIRAAALRECGKGLRPVKQRKGQCGGGKQHGGGRRRCLFHFLLHCYHPT